MRTTHIAWLGAVLAACGPNLTETTALRIVDLGATSSCACADVRTWHVEVGCEAELSGRL